MRSFLFLVFYISVNSALGQSTITGLIKDTAGQLLPGATIAVKKGATVSAGDNGSFTVPVAGFPASLRISSAGFAAKEVLISSATDSTLEFVLIAEAPLTEVVITSRRRLETAQSVPIPISVVGGARVEETGAFNVNRLKELVPAVQLYSSNPRNTTLNIRGMGSTFGLTNDGVDPGVGFYVDGVYFARPAATALDFIDIDQIEVLRGPQGTLFGKNTTAGAFNITTRAPSFTPGARFEVSYGNYGYIQAKASVTGAITKKLAGRFSFSGTQRDGLIENIRTERKVNDINNLGVRGQLLYKLSDRIKVTLAGDMTRQRPDGYAQVVAGVVPTLRPAYRQFNQIIADLNYQLPSLNAFDRKIDHNTEWRSGNDLGGVSLNIDAKIGRGTLTSTTAWRYWNWDPSNDRDFTGLSVLSLSQATSTHEQWTQEIRYAGDISPALSGVVGVFIIGQDLNTDPVHIEESGADQWRFSQSSTSANWQTPGLLDGYGIRTTSRLKSLGAAVFAQADWKISERFHILPGARFNYDEKQVNYNRQTYGGLQTTDPALIAIKNSVYSNQAFDADVDESNFSGQLTVSYKASHAANIFATYSTSFKPIGVNLGGLPTSNGEVLTELARIKPEYVQHFELGIKSKPFKGSTLNLVLHHTDIRDYQTQVQTAEVGVNRGYLANAEKVRVYGAELDANFSLSRRLSVYGNVAYTDAIYKSFTNAPVPLEETGGPSAFKDISGSKLPGVSEWAGSFGGELTSLASTFLGNEGQYFLAADGYVRSEFSSSPSPSKYLNIPGYLLMNARLGFRGKSGLSVFVWGRNIANKNYFEQLLPAAGNAGHYAAVLGDQRTYGVTIKYSL